MKSVLIQCFFWSVFSYIRTENGDLLRKSPYSVRIQENTDQKKLRIWTLFHVVSTCLIHLRPTFYLCMDTVQKLKFSIKNFFSKCDQIWRKLRIWSHLLKKSLIKNFIFCAVGENPGVADIVGCSGMHV